MELRFRDLEAVDTGLGLIEGDIEENFEDIGVRSVFNLDNDALNVEKQVKTPPRAIFGDYSTEKVDLKGILRVEVKNPPWRTNGNRGLAL